MRMALEVFAQARANGAVESDAWLVSLLRLIASLEDANVLARCGETIAQTLRSRAEGIALRYAAGGASLADEIRALDRVVVACNASPGGAADLLACAMFFSALEDRNKDLSEKSRASKYGIQL